MFTLACNINKEKNGLMEEG